MTHAARFFRFLCLLDGRGQTALTRIHGFSRATITRHLALARKLGVIVRYERITDRYHVIDAGPFDLVKLAQFKPGPKLMSAARSHKHTGDEHGIRQ